MEPIEITLDKLKARYYDMLMEHRENLETSNNIEELIKLEKYIDILEQIITYTQRNF